MSAGLGPAWLAVIGRAGGRCECTGSCGRKHDKDHLHRCLAVNDGSVPGRLLRAVAADYSVPPERAIGLPTYELTAMGVACDDLTAARARRRLRRAPEFSDGSLFGGAA